MEAPKYFRLLEAGEMVRAGDYFENPPYTLKQLDTDSSQPVTDEDIIWRPVQVDEWVEYAKQKPTEADGNESGNVQWVSARDGSSMVARWNYLPIYLTHWRRITPPQPIVKRVKVREQNGSEHEVIPQPDGSLKVGCAVIPAADFDEIIRQREAVKAKP